ncbi:MAG: hypothetical protein HXY42_15565 [Chloroflexi bacterium]|nr:hypothetical protein [Chloroflexota bacterium]
MNVLAIQGAMGVIILLLGRDLNFLFSAAMAAFIGTRLTHLLPPFWPSWTDLAFLAGLAVLAAGLTLISKETGYYVCGFLVGGFAFSEYFAPGASTLPLLPFIVGSVLGSVVIGLLGEWAMIVVACLIGSYLIYGVLPLQGTARTLAIAGIFVIGALVQVILFQMQKHSER